MKGVLLLALIAFVPLIICQPYNEGRELYNGQRKFYVELLRAFHTSGLRENRVISPYSIYHGLLMVYFGSEGETEQSLKRALHLDWAKDKEDVIRVYRELNGWHDRHYEDIEFKTIDRLFVTDKAELKPLMSTIFKDNIEKVNFSEDRNGVIERINRYIEEVTKGYVKNFYTENTITPHTNLVLTNAAYYRGRWEHQFNKEFTKTEKFYGYETTSVQMMKTEGRFIYDEIEELNSEYIRLPYKGADEDLFMYVVLPKEKSPSALDHLVEKMKPEILERILEGHQYERVYVELPKFEIETTKTLRETLTKMGIKNLFENSNLKGITENVDLKFDNMRHYAKIIVDEDGSNTSSGTGTIGHTRSDVVKFIANRPFWYFVYDKTLNGVLFSGGYRGNVY